MDIEKNGLYKVVVFLPEEFLELMMYAVDAVTRRVFPGYDRTFSYFPVTGTWRTLEDADPYSGKVGEISVDREMRLEFAVQGRDLLEALKAVRENHPYETPAIDVMPIMSGLTLLAQSSLQGSKL